MAQRSEHIRSVILFLLLILVVISSKGMGVQEEISADLIAYECENGFGVVNICAIKPDGTAQRQLTFARFSNEGFSQPSINSLGQVAHVCKLVPNRFDICVVNADGTSFHRVTFVSPYVNNFRPKINDEGIIVFSCSDAGTPQFICVAHAASGTSSQIEVDVGIEHSSELQIDSNGQVLFSCVFIFDTQDICTVKADGTGFAVVTQAEDRGEFNANASFNELGQVVFDCNAASTGHGICLLNLNDLEPRELIKATEERVISRPLINDAGEIVFSCSYSIFSGDLCSMTLEDGFERRLTEIERASFNYLGAILPNGQVAYRCHDSDNNDNLCVINIDGLGQSQLTFLNENEANSDPDINIHGHLAFKCENSKGELQACVIYEFGGEIDNLSERHGFEYVFELDMNDHGILAMSCELPDRGTDLCVLNLETDELVVLTEYPDSQGNTAADPSINNMNMIVYRCVLSFDSNICVSNVDGSFQDILTKAGQGEDFFSASINDANEIVFSCQFEPSVRNVCLLNLDKQISMVTVDAIRHGVLYNNPLNNNEGRVVVNCSDFTDDDLLLHVCSMNVDGSDFINHAINSTETYPAHEAWMNDDGTIVYACHNPRDGNADICVYELDGEGQYIESRLISPSHNFQPSINNGGEIAYQCLDLNGNRNICHHDLETGLTTQLTFLSDSGEVGMISSP